MTNTTTNRMKRLIADISEHGATPSRVKKITNALRAVTAERDAATESISELRELNVRLTDRIQSLCGEMDAAIARVAELERLVRIGDARCEQCADPATTIDSAGDAACAACAAKEESHNA